MKRFILGTIVLLYSAPALAGAGPYREEPMSFADFGLFLLLLALWIFLVFCAAGGLYWIKKGFRAIIKKEWSWDIVRKLVVGGFSYIVGVGFSASMLIFVYEEPMSYWEKELWFYTTTPFLFSLLVLLSVPPAATSTDQAAPSQGDSQ